MKITALTNSNQINQQLAKYALSLFEQTKTEVVDVTRETIDQITTNIESSNLVALIMDDKGMVAEYVNQSTLQQKPIFLLSTYVDETAHSETLKKTLNHLKNNNCEVWGVFSLPITTSTFNSELEITTISVRLTLIRLINSIMYHNLGIRNTNKFSCGITPPKHYVGDSIGY
jgi:hypothetical protein